MKGSKESRRRRQLRELVAMKAAELLYHGIFKEYIDAKRAAADDLGLSILPSNREVALKLLEYALSLEGENYWKRLVEMRVKALKLMKNLKDVNPRLVGSVWRGIIKPHSDIDIEVDSTDIENVENILRGSGYKILRSEAIGVPEPLKHGSLWRIRLLDEGHEVEVILKDHQGYVDPPRCDIFGDPRKGLNIPELRKTLERMPTKVFIPGRRNGWR